MNKYKTIFVCLLVNEYKSYNNHISSALVLKIEPNEIC